MAMRMLKKWRKGSKEKEIDVNALPTSMCEACLIIGALRTQIVNYEKALRIISMRCKLEDFVQKMFPRKINFKTGEILVGKPVEMSYCDAFAKILSSRDNLFTKYVYIKVIRDRLTSNNIKPGIFMEFVRWWFNQFPGESYHRMAAFAPPLPSYKDVPAINEMLRAVEIDEHIPTVKCIQIILEPLPLVPMHMQS